MGHALSRRHTQQPCVSTAEGGGLVSWWVLVGFALSSPVSWRALAGVVLFVFRLGVLVVRLEGIALCRSVCFLVVFARCCMSIQALLVGKARMV